MASSPRCEFDLCDGSGWLLDEETNSASPCRCRGRLIARRVRGSMEGGLPKRYRGVGFDRPPAPEIARVAPEQVKVVRDYVRDLDANLDSGRGLWLMGDVGTGKTTLAMIVSRAALGAGRSVAIYSLPRLLNLIRGAIETEAGMVGFLDRLAAVDLLHIDDLGAENQTEWVLEQLYSIVNARYEAERAIVATTNLMPDQLDERLGARTVSRLVEICGDPHPLFGDDRRREFRAQAPVPDGRG
jgi:DNA replication protein DnaC